MSHTAQENWRASLRLRALTTWRQKGLGRGAKQESHLAMTAQFRSNGHVSTPCIAVILAMGFTFWMFMILGLVLAVATSIFVFMNGVNKNTDPLLVIFGAFFLPVIIFAVFASIAVQFEDKSPTNGDANATVADSSLNSQPSEPSNSPSSTPVFEKAVSSSVTVTRYSTGYVTRVSSIVHK